MNKLKRILGLLMMCCMILSSGVFSDKVLAATVGQQLLTPEAGWTRYEDMENYAEFACDEVRVATGVGVTPIRNGWYKFEKTDTFPNEFTNNYEITSGGSKNASIKFKFTGDKFRVIGTYFYIGASHIKVLVDGVEVGEFSQQKPNVVGLGLTGIVCYDIQGLSDSIHTVTLANQGSDSFNVDAIDIAENGKLLNANTPVINIKPTTNTVNVGEEFVSDVVISNVYDIYAEDVKLTYDTKLFEYVGYEDVTGLKVYKESHDPVTGGLRFIIASQGKNNPINESSTVVKLKFKAKAAGQGKVDALAGRIANITTETDIVAEDCGEALITVKGYLDVNRTGEFSLVDLAIDGYYFGDLASNTDKTKYDADVVIDGNINDTDLSAIVNQILANKNYTPNM
jgi:hypothetical protein